MKNKTRSKYRTGAGIVDMGYVRSHPDFLKEFDIGDHVYLWHVDDWMNFMNNIQYSMDILKYLMDFNRNFDLNCENTNNKLNTEDIMELKKIIQHWRKYKQ